MSTSRRATKWTDPKLAAEKLPPGVRERRVLVAPNLYLYLRARADGTLSKQWQYRAQVDGSRRWLSLGSYPEVGLAKAVAERAAHDVNHEAAKKGEGDHPVLAARNQRKTAKALPTVSEVFRQLIEDRRLGSKRKGGRPVREQTIRILSAHFDNDIQGRIGELKIANLTRESIQACIDAPRRRGSPGTAAHVYRTLRSIVNFALKSGYVESDPMRAIDNPAPYRPKPPNAATDAEIKALFAALDDSKVSTAVRLAIELQLLTGARPGEVREARWTEIDLPRSLWLIPGDRVKSDRPFRIHLSRQAASLLQTTATVLAGSDYVFPGERTNAKEKDRPIEKMAVARALARLAERMEGHGGKRLTPHDLRKTFRTMLSRIGIAPHVAELCMNHQETETMRRVYDGHDYTAEMVDAWDRAAAHLSALRRGGALVIPIAAKRAR